MASGFASEPEPPATAEAYVCTASLPVVRLAHAALKRATDIWAELAHERGLEEAGGAGAPPDGRPRLATEKASVPVEVRS